MEGVLCGGCCSKKTNNCILSGHGYKTSKKVPPSKAHQTDTPLIVKMYALLTEVLQRSGKQNEETAKLDYQHKGIQEVVHQVQLLTSTARKVTESQIKFRNVQLEMKNKMYIHSILKRGRSNNSQIPLINKNM